MGLTDWIGGSESSSKSYIDKDQKPYLNDIYQQGQDLFNSNASPVASMSPEMAQYLQGATNFAGNAGAMSGQAWGQGNTGFDLGNSGGQYLNTILQNGGFSAPLQNGVNMNTVSQGINNDVLNGQIQAGTRDIYRNLNEQALPGIASNAVGSGNTGSTRRGIAEGIAMRGANDAAADVAANLRGNAYNTAYGVAANQAGANQGAQMQTNSMNASLGNTLFNTGMGFGFQGLGQGYDMGAGGVGFLGNAGDTSQNYWQQVAMAPWTKLGLYQQNVGAPTVLNQSSSSSTDGILNAVGNLAQGAGGFMTGMNS